MKLQLLLTLLLCITTTTSFAGGVISILFDNSTTVTIPNAATLNERVRESDVHPNFFMYTQFVPHFAEQTLTTNQLWTKIDSLFAVYGTANVLAKKQDTKLVSPKEHKQIVKPELYKILLKDNPTALQELLTKKS